MRPAHRPDPVRHHPRVRPYQLLLVLALLLPLGSTLRRVIAQEDSPNTPSPARVGQAVIAQGVAE
ncbi:MAG TPA: hypothetical protein VKB09_17530, partial [Thermomicrobiales bacterium]|nr:hypothetical protein [Thermomicrobiales bacterium]